MDSFYNEEALWVIVRERQAELRGEKERLQIWQPNISLMRPIKRVIAACKQWLIHLLANDNPDDTSGDITQQRQYT